MDSATDELRRSCIWDCLGSGLISTRCEAIKRDEDFEDFVPRGLFPEFIYLFFNICHQLLVLICPLCFNSHLPDEELPPIRHGEAITDRRSTFQPHLAPVVTPKQVPTSKKLSEFEKTVNICAERKATRGHFPVAAKSLMSTAVIKCGCFSAAVPPRSTKSLCLLGRSFSEGNIFRLCCPSGPERPNRLVTCTHMST